MYDTLKNAITNRLPDNTQGLITPAAMRTNFADAITALGEQSNFLGYAPLSNPTPTPDGKCHYITNPDTTATQAATYTGYGSNLLARVGQQYLLWYNGSQWQHTIIERDFQNANYGSTRSNGTAFPVFDQRGNITIRLPQSPAGQQDTRNVRILSDASAAQHLMRMTLDGADIEPSDYIELQDNNAHTVSLIFDQSYGNSNPPCLDHTAAEAISFPYGMTQLDTPVGTTTTELILPPTVTHIAAAAITPTSARSLTLTGAPPTLDSQINWSNINSLTIPDQYSTLYQRADWQAAIAAITTAGGTVNTDSGTPYDPTADRATTTQAGIVELATAAETLAGTDAERAVTPAGLAATKGNPGGFAELDANGKVPSSQLPAYVDDVLEYPTLADFPTAGTSGTIYIALDTNLTYRWSGTAYVEISPSLALGETPSTAYRGDRGKTAYDHATDPNRLTKNNKNNEDKKNKNQILQSSKHKTQQQKMPKLRILQNSKDCKRKNRKF